MGGIGGMMGLGGGASGTGFAAPSLADIQSPVNAQQTQQAYNQTQNAMQGQNTLLSALQGQNGLGNQSQVYGQLQGVASGAVNPSQAQFNQNTAQNVANQSAMMASQRGAGSNVGLMARQAGQQGAAIQQQAAGQEATQQAQNQIAGIQAAGQMANTMAGQQIGQVNANVGAQQANQAALLNATGQLNNANISNQASVNAGNAALAGTGMQGQQALVGGIMNGIGSMSQMGGGGGGGGGGGAGMAAMAASSGGRVPGYAEGGAISGPQSEFGQFLAGVSAPGPSQVELAAYPTSNPGAQELAKGASAATKKMMQQPSKVTGQSTGGYDGANLGVDTSMPTMQNPVATTSDMQAYQLPDQTPQSSYGNAQPGPKLGVDTSMSGGGKVPVMISPGEKLVSPQEAQKCAQGGKPKMQTVPGRPQVAGDSLKNDKVAAKLEPGTIVVKRTRANNNPEGFIKEVLAKRKGNK